MSITEILDELPKLDVEERHTLMDRLNELEAETIPLQRSILDTNF